MEQNILLNAYGEADKLYKKEVDELKESVLNILPILVKVYSYSSDVERIIIADLAYELLYEKVNYSYVVENIMTGMDDDINRNVNSAFSYTTNINYCTRIEDLYKHKNMVEKVKELMKRLNY